MGIGGRAPALPTTAPAGRRSSTPLTPGGQPAPSRLGVHTLTALADRPHARRLVRCVWDKLAELERAGQHPGAIAALRRVLDHHQPTPAGRCRTCRRGRWRHQPFPCIVWHEIGGELLGWFAATVRTPRGAHRPANRGSGGVRAL